MSKKIDNIFAEEQRSLASSFTFDQRVVSVFDDMVSRSVPGYSTIQLLVADLALKYADGKTILDLGCSTGETIFSINRRSENLNIPSPYCVGIDSSAEMIDKAKGKLAGVDNLLFSCCDFTQIQTFSEFNPQVVILSLVLQFIRPINRPQIIKNIYQSLPSKGALIVVEKTVEENPNFNSVFIDYYHSFKKEMGYSDMEIANKREALENVLIPFQREENINLFNECGFKNVTTFFQWFNFCGFLAVKE